MTVDQSFAHDGSGICDGIKTEESVWSLNGHKDRLIDIGETELGLFAELYDEVGTPPIQARLPVIHSLTTTFGALATILDTANRGSPANSLLKAR